MVKRIEYEVGHKFPESMLFYIYDVSLSKHGQRRMFAYCSGCGGTTIVLINSVTRGKTTSCGCEQKKAQLRTDNKHTTHNDTGTRLYNIHGKMINRCHATTSKRYANYGGRGVRVCPEWHDYVVFKKWALANGYTDALTIDRKNETMIDYCPENCWWATSEEQACNRRGSLWWVIKGKLYQSATRAAKDLGVSYYKIRAWCGHENNIKLKRNDCYTTPKYNDGSELKNPPPII